MNISSPGTLPVSYQPPQAAADSTAQDLRALSQAAEAVNSRGAAGDGREFSIAIDRVSRQVVVRIVDAQTRDVIEQTPADYLLRLRDYYSSLKD